MREEKKKGKKGRKKKETKRQKKKKQKEKKEGKRAKKEDKGQKKKEDCSSMHHFNGESSPPAAHTQYTINLPSFPPSPSAGALFDQ